jgi:NAD(P)-dependent dehydrogenase (short-subunit alcohol dehydrogenase family)
MVPVTSGDEIMELKTAVVTGANKGIGFEVARQLASQGFHVWLGARNVKRGESAVQDLTKLGLSVSFLHLDIDDEKSVRSAAQSFASGKLDVLVNNAAILLDKSDTLDQTPLDILKQTFDTNVAGTVRVTQRFLPLLKKAKRARVINVSSGAGQLSSMSTYAPAYSISKTALNAVTVQFAQAFKEQGIVVNAVCPGWVKTDMGGPGAPRSVEEGADGIVWLATAAPLSHTGKFFRDRQEIPW